MARKSKSSKNTTKPEASGGAEPSEIEASEAGQTNESSSDDAPVIIEAEAVDVTTSDENSPEGDTMADDPSGKDTDDMSKDSETESSAENDSETGEATDPTNTEEDDTATEPIAAIPPPPAPPAKASPVPLVLGGLVAGGIGYLAATFAQPTAFDTSALSESIEVNEARLEALASGLSDLQNAPAVVDADLGPVEDALAALAVRLDGLDGSLASVRDEIANASASFEQSSNALSDRLTVLETAGPGDSEQARATEEDLAAFRAELERMTADAEDRVAASMEKASEIEAAALAAAAEAEETAEEAERLAAEAAAQAEKEAALALVTTALESGQSYADEIAVLDGEIPDVLSANAESGVVTLVELQQSFPDAARLALANAATVPQDASAGERVAAFFKQRTNARSLTPKEGNSADAVLSRAEAMMKQGDLEAALAELEFLDDAPKSAMQAWLDQANTRQAALAAVAQLTATN